MAASATTQPATTPEKRLLQYIEVTNAAMQKAAAFEATVQQQKAAAQEKKAAAVDALIANERVRKDQRDELMGVLDSHAGTLDLLTKLAAHRSSAEIGRLGSGADSTKEAGAQTGRPFGGVARTKTAGVKLFKDLGLPLPSGE